MLSSRLKNSAVTSVLAAVLLTAVPNAARAIVAGDPNGTPPDSPAQRVDANTITSAFAGVVSITLTSDGVPLGSVSGAAIDARHILTAAHVLNAIIAPGLPPSGPEDYSVHLNFGSDNSHVFSVLRMTVHPDWVRGDEFANINDDLGIITLTEDLPGGVPIYPLYRRPAQRGEVLTLVGYGDSGNPIYGYETRVLNKTVKRQGSNVLDEFVEDDEGSGQNEVFVYDFDGPDATTNFLGGPTLGNVVETLIGDGDSGSPAFVFADNQWQIAGVNTFTAGGPDFPPFTTPPAFGSLGGGVLVHPYLDWIDATVRADAPEPGSLILMAMCGPFLIRRRRARKTTRIR